MQTKTFFCCKLVNVSCQERTFTCRVGFYSGQNEKSAELMVQKRLKIQVFWWRQRTRSFYLLWPIKDRLKQQAAHSFNARFVATKRQYKECLVRDRRKTSRNNDTFGEDYEVPCPGVKWLSRSCIVTRTSCLSFNLHNIWSRSIVSVRQVTWWPVCQVGWFLIISGMNGYHQRMSSRLKKSVSRTEGFCMLGEIRVDVLSSLVTTGTQNQKEFISADLSRPH